MSNSIRSGESRSLAIPSGQSIAISSIVGTVTAAVTAGTAKGTTLLSDSTGGGTFGPYTSGAVVLVQAGVDSIVDYDIGTSPINSYQEAAKVKRGVGGDSPVLVDDSGEGVAAQSLVNKSNKKYYIPNGTSVTPGSTIDQTWCAKFAIPADAFEVGLTFHHHDTSNALTGVRACIAATESFYPHNTTDDKFHPFVQGSGRRVLDDATSLYGWRSVTWGGSASPTLGAPSAVGGVGFVNLSNLPSRAESDGIILPPDVLPSATDIAAGGDPAFRYVLARVYVPGSAGNKYAFSAFTSSPTRSSINNGWVSRFSIAAGDKVTTSINSSTGDASFFLPVGLWYRSASSGYGVVVFGDSLTQGQGLAVGDEQMQPWAMRAAHLAGADFVNFGCSGQTQDTFYTVMQSVLPTLGVQVAMFQSGSPNNGPWTTVLGIQQYFQLAKQRTLNFISTAIAAGKMPYVATMPPSPTSIIASSSTGKLIDNERVAHNNWVRTLTAAKVFDYDAILTDNGTVDANAVCRIQASLTGDGLHGNEAASKLLATALAAILP